MQTQYNSLSDIIFSTIYHDAIADEGSPFNQLKKKLYDIDKDYFEKIPADTERLHQDLNPALRDSIVEDFRKLAEKYLGASYEDHLVQSIQQMKDAHFPDADPQSIVEACDKAKKELLDAAQFRFNHPTSQYEEPCSKVSEATMMNQYKKAKERTFTERITQTNKAEVIAFHHTLMQKTVWDCKQLIEDKVITLIGHITERLSERYHNP